MENPKTMYHQSLSKLHEQLGWTIHLQLGRTNPSSTSWCPPLLNCCRYFRNSKNSLYFTLVCGFTIYTYYISYYGFITIYLNINILLYILLWFYYYSIYLTINILLYILLWFYYYNPTDCWRAAPCMEHLPRWPHRPAGPASAPSRHCCTARWCLDATTPRRHAARGWKPDILRRLLWW